MATNCTLPSSSSRRLPRLQRGENFGMRQLDPVAIAGLGIGIEGEDLSRFQINRVFGKSAKPQFGSLKINQDSDWPAG